MGNSIIRFNLISRKCIDNVMSQSTFRVNSLNPESVRSMKSQLSFAHVTLPVLMLPCRKIMKSLSRVRKILSKVVWQFKGKNSESFVFFFSSSASNQLIWFFKPLFSVIFSFFFRSVEITVHLNVTNPSIQEIQGAE